MAFFFHFLKRLSEKVSGLSTILRISHSKKTKKLLQQKLKKAISKCMKVNIDCMVYFNISHPNTWLMYLISCSIHGNGSSYKHFLFQKDENWRFEFKIIIYSFLTIPQQWMKKIMFNKIQEHCLWAKEHKILECT